MQYFLILFLYFLVAFLRNFCVVIVFAGLIPEAEKMLGIPPKPVVIGNKWLIIEFIASLLEVYYFHNLMQYYLVFHKI